MKYQNHFFDLNVVLCLGTNTIPAFTKCNISSLALLSFELELDDGAGFPSFTSGISLERMG